MRGSLALREARAPDLSASSDSRHASLGADRECPRQGGRASDRVRTTLWACADTSPDTPWGSRSSPRSARDLGRGLASPRPRGAGRGALPGPALRGALARLLAAARAAHRASTSSGRALRERLERMGYVAGARRRSRSGPASTAAPRRLLRDLPARLAPARSQRPRERCFTLRLDGHAGHARCAAPTASCSPAAELEPEIIAQFHGEERADRHLVALADVPPVLVDAIIAIEDQSFFEHSGIQLVAHRRRDRSRTCARAASSRAAARSPSSW